MLLPWRSSRHSEIEGMSVRIDLRDLDDTRRQAMLTQLAEITERLKAQTRR
jgi:hypothetical protein